MLGQGPVAAACRGCPVLRVSLRIQHRDSNGISKKNPGHSPQIACTQVFFTICSSGQRQSGAGVGNVGSGPRYRCVTGLGEAGLSRKWLTRMGPLPDKHSSFLFTAIRAHNNNLHRSVKIYDQEKMHLRSPDAVVVFHNIVAESGTVLTWLNRTQETENKGGLPSGKGV